MFVLVRVACHKLLSQLTNRSLCTLINSVVSMVGIVTAPAHNCKANIANEYAACRQCFRSCTASLHATVRALTRAVASLTCISHDCSVSVSR